MARLKLLERGMMRRLSSRDTWNAVEALDHCGISRPFAAWCITGPPLYIIITLAAFVAIALSPFVACYLDCRAKEVVEILFSLGAAVVAIQQWRLAKTEASLDKFYDRLNLTNNRLDFWRYARPIIRAKWLEERTFEAEMYVCLEVDNLEYVIQRYQRGYMDPRDTYRELTCFRSRCQPETGFRKLALEVVNNGGYKQETIDAIVGLCNTCKHESNCKKLLYRTFW